MPDEEPETARLGSWTAEDRERAAAAEKARFYGAINAKDDIVYLLLRLHLLTEHALERHISCYLRRGDRLLAANRLSYHLKVAVVRALDLVPDGALDALEKLNAIRNRCSHRREQQVTRADIDSVGRCLGDEYRRIVAQFEANAQELLQAIVAKAYFAVLKPVYAAKKRSRAGGT